jgi:gliding motility-associated-like protein
VERNINIEVNDVVTINGDQINDSWFIKNIDQYPGNSVRVFDRWGGLIFQSTGYNNNEVVWNGESNSSLMYSDKYVSTGTYFYAIDLGNGSKSITGAIEVIR